MKRELSKKSQKYREKELENHVDQVIINEDIEEMKVLSKTNISHDLLFIDTKLSHAKIILSKKEYILFLKQKSNIKFNFDFSCILSIFSIVILLTCFYNQNFNSMETAILPFLVGVGLDLITNLNQIGIKERKKIKNELKNIKKIE